MLVQLSDPHLGGPGAAEALAAGVARVLALDTPPDAVLVSGDIADTGAPAEYELARELLAPLGPPVRLLAGNHDALPERTAYAVACGGLRLVACDTSIPGRDDGRLDVGWLAARLAEDTETPTIVALHHHPVALLGGCPVVTCTSTNRQARLELGGTAMRLTDEPPSLLVHALAGGELVTHIQPI